MNDELTPSERAALRARIVGGAHGIKPVGAHRNAAIAGSIAAVLVVAIAGGVAATSTLSAPDIANTPSPTATVETVVPTSIPEPIPTPTPSPSSSSPPAPAPSSPVIAFDGECGQMLTDAEASELLVDGVATLYSERELGTNRVDSLALLGGLSCVWLGHRDSVSVVVAAPSAVAPDLVESLSSVTCSVDRGCATGRVEGDLWVGALVSATANDYEAGFTQEEVSAAAARLERVITRVAAKPHASPVASIDTAARDGWTLPDCGALRGRLEEVTGLSLSVQAVPGANLNSLRLVESLLMSSAGVTTCAYRESVEGSREYIEVALMPGASAPPASALAVTGTMEISVAGADRAWDQVIPDHAYLLDLVAVVGENRLLVRRSTAAPAVTGAERIATAVLSSLR